MFSPVVIQLELPPRRKENGSPLMGAKTAFDNPDTVYRNFYVFGHSTYVIHAAPVLETPAEFTVSVLDDRQQTKSCINKTDLKVDPDGQFEIVLSNKNTTNNPNHLYLPSNA